MFSFFTSQLGEDVDKMIIKLFDISKNAFWVAT